MFDVAIAGLVFLINTFFDLYLFVLGVRLILVFVHANYFDQFTQFIVRLTNPLVKPVRYVLPNLGRVELATIFWMIILDMIKFFLIYYLTTITPNILGILIISISHILKILLYTFFFAILLQAILSWMQPNLFANRILMQFNRPILSPFHRIIPLVSGIDISPIFALIFLQLLIIAVADPLMKVGQMMVFK